METKPNIEQIIHVFPNCPIQNTDKNWCSAFVCFCCVKAGFDIPIRPKESISCNLAGCGAWEEWVMINKKMGYHLADNNTYTPEAGDIVLFDKVFCNSEHDHIGIIIECKLDSIVVTEGNINNISGVIERKIDEHIRAYIKILKTSSQ